MKPACTNPCPPRHSIRPQRTSREHPGHPIVEFRDVVRSFGSGTTEIRAVNGIPAAVAHGDFVAVMGPSGCGKSTPLHLAAAEDRDERNVLAVVGATPASMRRQASARGTVLALSGIVLGIPTGLLPTPVLDVDSSISTEPLRFPWLVTAGLILLVPALVAAVAWVASGVGQRFRPPTPARRD